MIISLSYVSNSIPEGKSISMGKTCNVYDIYYLFSQYLISVINVYSFNIVNR